MWVFNFMNKKEEELKKLEEEIQNDFSLPLQESNLVFGEGNIDCGVMFIGEAPGFHENLLKRPFVGRGGQLLDKLIQSVGWRREDVYITNIVKRRPPENRDPSPQEIEAYKPYLTRQIEIINPLIVATLGRFSMNYFLPNAKITRDNGKVFRVGRRFLMPFFHPAAALRSPATMKALAEGFQKLPAVVKKCETVAAEEPTIINEEEEKTKNQASLF